jgi:tRNA (adenine22-N1)-methyltransferase
MKPVILSKRLQAVADMVSKGNRVCDVGCDHGFVSIYLVEQGVSPFVLAMDVRKGPLGAAAEHVEERGLHGAIEIRLSDGLHNYEPGEADSLVCAGMGGKLMARILSEDWKKTDSFHELVLQPQSEIEGFRRFLYNNGYFIEKENMIEEEGKFYPMMRVRKAEGMQKTPGRLACRYGPLLMENGSTVLLSFLRREEQIYQEILDSLRTAGLSEPKRIKRYTEVEKALQDTKTAVSIVSEENRNPCSEQLRADENKQKITGGQGYGYDYN